MFQNQQNLIAQGIQGYVIWDYLLIFAHKSLKLNEYETENKQSHLQ
jgi:hypothetical protein